MAKQESSSEKDNTQIGIAIIVCVVCWPLPVLSGFFCNLAQAGMIGKMLEHRRLDSHLASKIFWSYRWKHIPLLIGTYLPWAGIPFQIADVCKIAKYTVEYIAQNDLQLREESKRGWFARNMTLLVLGAMAALFVVFLNI